MEDDSLPTADEVRARLAQAEATELASARKRIADSLRGATFRTLRVYLHELSRETKESLRPWIEERGFNVDFTTNSDPYDRECSTVATITVPAAATAAAVSDEKAPVDELEAAKKKVLSLRPGVVGACVVLDGTMTDANRVCLREWIKTQGFTVKFEDEQIAERPAKTILRIRKMDNEMQ